jgi:hypothetical protein
MNRISACFLRLPVGTRREQTIEQRADVCLVRTSKIGRSLTTEHHDITSPSPAAGDLWRIGRLWRTLSPRRNPVSRTLSALSALSAHVFPKGFWTIRPQTGPNGLSLGPSEGQPNLVR